MVHALPLAHRWGAGAAPIGRTRAISARFGICAKERRAPVSRRAPPPLPPPAPSLPLLILHLRLHTAAPRFPLHPANPTPIPTKSSPIPNQKRKTQNKRTKNNKRTNKQKTTQP
jgi:hypothetical protein